MINKCLYLITSRDKINLSLILAGMIILSLLEFISIGAIPIFVNFLMNSSNQVQLIHKLTFGYFNFDFLNKISVNNLFIFSTIFLFSLFLMKSIYTIVFIFFETKILKVLVCALSNKMFQMYINSDYLYFKSKKTSDIIRNLNDNVDAVRSITAHIIKILKETFVIVAIFLLLLFNNFFVTLVIFLSLSIFTISFYKFISPRLYPRGTKLQIMKSNVYRTIAESLGSLHHIKILKKEKLFFNIFDKRNSNKYSHIFYSRFVSQIPRIALELLIVFLFLFIVVYFLLIEKNLSEFFPFISLVLVSSARLVPSFNIYNGSFTSIRFQIPHLDKIYDEMQEMNNLEKSVDNNNISVNKPNEHNLVCQLENINFNYPNRNNLFDSIDLEIKKGEIIGFLGKSGSGKSTLVEIIMGLISPTSGKVKIFSDKTNFYNKEINNLIGYIPQNIFLIDDSIEKNISLEFDSKLIDQKKMDYAIKLSQLENFIESLPKGLKTPIGERGANISGGQHQRIGIARSLYHEFDLLIMDEATNALDEYNTKEIANCILDLKKINKSIIIISHDKILINFCDHIYKINNSKLVKSK